MNGETQGNDAFKVMEWVLGSAGTLLVVSAGLELFAQHAGGRVSMGAVLLALYLAFWSYVLGMAVLLLLPMWLVMRRLHARLAQAAMRKVVPAAQRSRHLEKPWLEDPQFQHEPMAPVPTQSSRDGGTGIEPRSFTRVA